MLEFHIVVVLYIITYHSRCVKMCAVEERPFWVGCLPLFVDIRTERHISFRIIHRQILIEANMDPTCGKSTIITVQHGVFQTHFL